MAEKQFIGKVFEKTFNNGGSVIKLTLSEEEKELLYNKAGDTTIEVKKSQKGKWYAEISQYQGQAETRPSRQQHTLPNTFTDESSDLPF